MILEARTLCPLEAERMAAAGWTLARGEGSESLWRWPDRTRWPANPLSKRGKPKVKPDAA